MHHEHDDIYDLVQKIDKLVTAHMIEEEARNKELRAAIDHLARAFVKNDEGKADVEKHLNYHKQRDDDLKVFKERKKKFVDRVVDSGGWAVFLFVLWAVWEAIKSKVHLQ